MANEDETVILIQQLKELWMEGRCIQENRFQIQRKVWDMWISMDKLPLVKTLLNAFSASKDEVSFNASTLTVDTVLGRRKFLSKV